MVRLVCGSLLCVCERLLLLLLLLLDGQRRRHVLGDGCVETGHVVCGKRWRDRGRTGE